jgi:hypothetical protein
MSNEIATTSPSQLMQIAVEQNADVDKLEKLMELQERWNAGQAKSAYYESFTQFQSELPVIEKKKSGHNIKYAPLSDIVEQIKPLLVKHGLSFRFEQNHSEGIEVTCIVTHSAGHSERTTMKAAADTSGSKNSVQAIASTVTYLSRYTLCSAFGITTADEDMDGRLPPPEIVTEAQAKEIKDLLQETDSDVKAFCKSFGCASVDMLPAKSYTRAKAMINAKKDKS